MPPDNVNLLRLTWHPVDFDKNGKVKACAFPRADLKGQEDRYLSVDRQDLCDVAVQCAILAAQQVRRPYDRQLGFAVPVLCGAVREFSDDAGIRPFSVSVEPVPADDANAIPANPAHCRVDNVSGKNTNDYIDELRTALITMSGPRLPIFCD